VVSVAGDQWKSIKGRIFDDDQLADEQQTDGNIDSNSSATVAASGASENNLGTSDTRQQMGKISDTAGPSKTAGIHAPDIYDAIKEKMYAKAYREAMAKIEAGGGALESHAVSGEETKNATSRLGALTVTDEPAPKIASTATATSRTTANTTGTEETGAKAAEGRPAKIGLGRGATQANPAAAQEFSNRDKKEGGKRVFIDLGANCGMFRV
jgi:hypothetical protein